MAIVLSLVRPLPVLLDARRALAPHARFDRRTQRWTMSEAEYARFSVEAVRVQSDHLVPVHEGDGRGVPPNAPTE